ncbi:hypothetical protein ACS0TY_023777 [Phlomoides rotata]
MKVNWAFKAGDGNSGGLLTIWDANKFKKSSVWTARGMLAINGIWLMDDSRCSLINVYAPHTLRHKWELWDTIATVTEQYKDCRVGIIGDFNAIQEYSERCGRSSNLDVKDMDKFEEFINVSNLLEIKMIGKKFTWYRPDGCYKSKLDRLLVNVEWSNKWPAQTLRGEGRTLSDHRPIFIEERERKTGDLSHSKCLTGGLRNNLLWI